MHIRELCCVADIHASSPHSPIRVDGTALECALTVLCTGGESRLWKIDMVKYTYKDNLQ